MPTKITNDEYIKRVICFGFQPIEDYVNNNVKIQMQCPCGKIFKCAPTRIFDGNKRTCGHCNDIKIGDVFGLLTVTGLQQKNLGCNVIALCKCGNTISLPQWRMKRIKSCGCLQSTDEYKLQNNQPKCDMHSLQYRCPEIIIEWDNIKNGSLTPNMIKYGSNRRVWWICGKCNNSYIASVKSRTTGKTGCPKCKISKGEKIIHELLNDWKIEYYTQKRFKECRDVFPLPFDFHLPKYNTLIEYNGRQHYELAYFGKHGHDTTDLIQKLNRIKNHDDIKQQYCKKYDIKLIIIKYTDMQNIADIFTSHNIIPP